MLVTRPGHARSPRRGIILLVVLALLTLFAVLGITFVLVANSQETSARIARESETQNQPNFDSELALSLYLGQLIYDVNDNATGVYSSIRGSSLARTAYGFNSGTDPVTGNPVPNDKAFCGTGRLHNTVALGSLGNADEASLVNYQYFPNDGFLRDPERPGTRSGLGAAQQPYIGGANVPYTYPDHQNFFLAYQDATTGQILVPSFHREYLFGRLDDPNNPNWTNGVGRYLTARPRPVDVDPTGAGGFPSCGDRGGDVKNLDAAPGGNDSIWTDPGFPVMVNPDGRKYKILVAPLVLELDSRLNLNVVGNLVGNSSWPSNTVTNSTPVGTASSHASLMGWGPWEVNPSLVLNADAPTLNEWKQVIYGSTPTGNPHVLGRYGVSRVGGVAVAGGGTSPRGWAAVDYNGLDESKGYTTETGYLLPGASSALGGSNSPYSTLPLFPAMRYGLGTTPPSSPWPSEATAHPRYYNPLRPVTGSDNIQIPVHAMHQLLRYRSTNGDYLTSDLLRLLPTNLVSDGGAPKRRNLVTLLSNDIDQPGIPPYVWDPAGTSSAPSAPYVMNTALTPPYPQAGAIPFPNFPGTVPAISEFDQASWRSLLTTLGRINLNRALTPFPVPVSGTINGVFPPANQTQAQQALADRQQFASDIFARLVLVTTGYSNPTAACTAAYNSGPQPGQSTQYQALRYLAQLSANIVDYIDTDDQSTPFNWYTPTTPMQGQSAPIPEWVFGTELPRVLINEGYVQLDNNSTPAPANLGTAAAPNYASQAQLNVNVWLELFNPVQPDPVSTTATTGTQDTTAWLESVAAPASGSTPAIPATNLYQIQLVNPAALPTLAMPGNTAGAPDYLQTSGTNIYSTVSSFSSVSASVTAGKSWSTIPPLSPPAQAPSTATAGTNALTATAPQGFYVIGPTTTGANFVGLNNKTSPETPARTYLSIPTTAPYNLPYSFESAKMTYTVANTYTPTTVPPPVVLLQRLACPLLPYNNNPASSTYNPFITIDSFTFQSSQINDSRYYTTTGPNTPTPMIQRTSYGRMQPFANLASQIQPQNPPTPPTTQPQTTFFSHNTPLTSPFIWNAHLDRNLICPTELLLVHGGRPMDLTAQAVTASGTLNTSRFAPWLDQQSRLHRFLEVAETRPITVGVAPWGRIPGRLNINGIWEPEVFNALCDRQPGNVFQAADVTTVFNQMKAQRSPNIGVFSGSTTSPLNNTWYMPGPTDLQIVNAANAAGTGVTGVSGNKWQLDRPFWGYGTGYATGTDAMAQSSTGGRGLDNTLLRPLTPGGTGFSAPLTLGVPATNTAATHPFQQLELLNKISNSTTTRSNVFAVFLTVGFFTVTDDTKVPVQLGAEIGRSENRQVRHRMFAIVDRSNLTTFTTASTAAITGTAIDPPLQAIAVPTTGTNSNTGRNWAIQPGMYLTYEPNTNNEETVLVQQNNQAAFTLTHPQGCAVINRGNPGPWLRYDPRQDGGVVPYFAVVD